MASGSMTQSFAGTGLPGSQGALVAAAALAAVLLAPAGCSAGDEGARVQEATLDGRRFRLELALNDKTRYRGLSDRKEIAPDGGMLFAFPKPQVLVFVMRRCLVPIDIIFVGANGRIVRMHEMEVEPYGRAEEQLKRYSSEWPAQFAIELKGGTLGELRLKPGQEIDLPLSELKRRAR